MCKSLLGMHTSLQMPVFELCFLILIDLIDIGLHGTCTSIERAAICLNEQIVHIFIEVHIFIGGIFCVRCK